jgi:adenylate kinase
MKLIFLGPPGVGKGTYASRVGPRLNIPHISTGDILRAARDDPEYGEKIRQFQDTGGLVPDEIVMALLKKRLEQPDAQKGFILDGFPRTIAQAEALEEITGIDAVVNLSLDEDVLIEKISARRICRNCGEIYNLANINRGDLKMPPILPKEEGKCDKCGGELYQRSDEKPEIVKERLQLYKDKTAPLIDHYSGKGILKNIEVTGGPDIMVPRILELIGAKTE